MLKCCIEIESKCSIIIKPSKLHIPPISGFFFFIRIILWMQDMKVVISSENPLKRNYILCSIVIAYSANFLAQTTHIYCVLFRLNYDGKMQMRVTLYKWPRKWIYIGCHYWWTVTFNWIKIQFPLRVNQLILVLQKWTQNKNELNKTRRFVHLDAMNCHKTFFSFLIVWI